MKTLHLLLLLVLTSQICASLPTAVLYYLPVGNKVTFYADLSTGSIQSYTWDFGDDTPIVTTSERSVDHYYPFSSLWKVSLTVVDLNNSTNSIANLVLSPSNDFPTANFTIVATNPTGIYLEASQSTDPDGTITQYFWDMGDGTGEHVVADSSIFHYQYARSGLYHISLKVTDNSRANSSAFSTTRLLAAFSAGLNEHQLTLDGGDPSDTVVFYSWDFGDNNALNFSTLPNPIYTYVLSGIYKVRLTVTDNSGRSDSTWQQFLVDTAPQAQFEVISIVDNHLTLNARNTWSDNNSSIVKVEWDWDDGTCPTVNTEIDSNVLRTYEKGGSYSVKLTVTDNYGKSDSLIKTILVNAIPRVTFEALGIVNDTIKLKAKVSDIDGTVSNFTWVMGDGNTVVTDVDTIEYTYARGWNYNVCLQVQDNLGANNTYCDSFFINRNPTAGFSVSTSSSDPNTIIITHDDSVDHDGWIKRYFWTWGDGTVELNNQTNITHTYALGGVYTISLAVIDNLGGKDTFTQEITVNALPVSIFTLTVFAENNTVSVNAASSQDSDGSIVEYVWNWGDGSQSQVLTNGQDDVQHTYALGGSYIITLVVKDNMGLTDSSSQQFSINLAPYADFEVVTILDEAWVIVNAKAFLQTPSNTRDLDGTLTSIVWNFGDGSGNITNTTHSAQVHQYDQGGNFTITLYAIDNFNLVSQTVQKQIFLNRPPATADFTFQFTTNGTLILDASLSQQAPGFPIIQYCWNFGNAEELFCTDTPTTSYLYNQSGDYIISLFVIDNRDLQSSNVAQQVVFVNQSPYALFRVLKSFPTGVVTLESSADETTDLDGYIASYRWDFGDGTFVIIKNTTSSRVQHQYQQSGLYYVTLQATDNAGGTNSITLPVSVIADEKLLVAVVDEHDPTSPNYFIATNKTVASFASNKPPEAKILFSVQSLVVSLSAQGSTDADGTIRDFFWDLGDGTTSSESNLNHTYAQGGLYEIKLTVTDNLGADSSTVSQALLLNYVPQASFSFKAVEPLTVTLDASQSLDIDGTIVSYNWSLGDGSDALIKTSGEPFNYTYASSGFFTITLTVQDNTGAQSAVSVQNIHLAEQETAPITAVQVNSGLPLMVYLKNSANNQYLSFTFDENLENAASLFTQDALLISDATDTTIVNSNLRFYRKAGTNTFYVMNQNGLALSVIDSTTFEVSKQNPSATTSFQVYSYGNYYQFVDQATGLYLALTSDQKALQLIASPQNRQDALWSIIVPQNPAYNNQIPINL